MMMTTQQFFNSTSNNNQMISSMNSSAQNSTNANSHIKTIAQAKLRKQRQNRGASNPIQHENSMSIQGNGDY